MISREKRIDWRLVVLSVGLAATALYLFSSTARELDTVVYRGESRLCSVTPDGGQPYCIRRNVGSPAFAPDGQSIAVEKRYAAKVAAETGGPFSQIVVIDRRGNLISIFTDSENFMRPAWSPDGAYVYAVSYRSDANVVRWRVADGRREVVRLIGLDQGKTPVQAITISPSGQEVALLNRKFTRIIIGSVSEDVIVRRLSKDFQYAALPKWLNDQHIVFAGKEWPDRRSKILKIDVTTGVSYSPDITGVIARDWVAPSPDGKELVFTAASVTGELKWGLWKASADGGPAIRLTGGREDVSPSWSPR